YREGRGSRGCVTRDISRVGARWPLRDTRVLDHKNVGAPRGLSALFPPHFAIDRPFDQRAPHGLPLSSALGGEFSDRRTAGEKNGGRRFCEGELVDYVDGCRSDSLRVASGHGGGGVSRLICWAIVPGS